VEEVREVWTRRRRRSVVPTASTWRRSEVLASWSRSEAPMWRRSEAPAWRRMRRPRKRAHGGGGVDTEEGMRWRVDAEEERASMGVGK
jgi:hypothetical protein